MVRHKYSFLLVLTALIWGLAFVAQSSGSAYLGAATFTCVRFFIGALVLLPVIRYRDAHRPQEQADEQHIGTAGERDSEKKGAGREVWRAGAVCGFFLAAASLLQQAGISMGTSAGKAGFLTAIYIVLVPIFGRLLFAHRISLQVKAGVILSLIGLYLLCMRGPFTILRSDLLVLLCAFLYALQILSVDRFAAALDPIRLSAAEFFCCGVFSFAVMAATELRTEGIAVWASHFAQMGAWIPLLYAGVFSSGVAYTLQVVAQKHVEPALASILMSLESVFAAVGGWLILRQTMTFKEILGSLIVFAAVLLSQIEPQRVHREA